MVERHSATAAVHHVGVTHRGADVAMAQQFLNRSDGRSRSSGIVVERLRQDASSSELFTASCDLFLMETKHVLVTNYPARSRVRDLPFVAVPRDANVQRRAGLRVEQKLLLLKAMRARRLAGPS
jgi:hypothetical protein